MENPNTKIDPLMIELRTKSFEELIDLYSKTKDKILSMTDDLQNFEPSGETKKPLMIEFFTALKLKLILREKLPIIKNLIVECEKIELSDLNTYL